MLLNILPRIPLVVGRLSNFPNKKGPAFASSQRFLLDHWVCPIYFQIVSLFLHTDQHIDNVACASETSVTATFAVNFIIAFSKGTVNLDNRLSVIITSTIRIPNPKKLDMVLNPTTGMRAPRSATCSGS